MFDEEKQIKTNVTIYHKLEDGVIVTNILVFMHGNANSGKAYYFNEDDEMMNYSKGFPERSYTFSGGELL